MVQDTGHMSGIFFIGACMPNLRIIYNNVADTATIQANNTASGFSVDNLKNTQKTSVHRSSQNTVAYTLTWSTPQPISCVALPATNLVNGATIQVQGYAELSDTDPILTTANLQACKNRNIVLNKVVQTTPSYLDFAFGGATKTSVWFTRSYNIKKLVITLSNAHFIDCARIVCGTYWESSRQASNGISLGFNDLSETVTTRSGNTYVDKKPILETMEFNLQYINDTDRQELLRIMRSWGTSGLVYLCVFPDNTNPEVTQSYSIYGRSQSNSIQYQLYSLYSANLNISSW